MFRVSGCGYCGHICFGTSKRSSWWFRDIEEIPLARIYRLSRHVVCRHTELVTRAFREGARHLAAVATVLAHTISIAALVLLTLSQTAVSSISYLVCMPSLLRNSIQPPPYHWSSTFLARQIFSIKGMATQWYCMQSMVFSFRSIAGFPPAGDGAQLPSCHLEVIRGP